MEKSIVYFCKDIHKKLKKQFFIAILSFYKTFFLSQEISLLLWIDLL